ncbi:MAG: RnfABCDGE type electron transport complex subunit A [Defluviitaleaceae bacterium]|nr:RnfABCDGE type electron transport complex subunit A [Defluviitaleaceae bacterium]MCL2239692.1 RnfABCDGE type electron transport complex subunit A [Defluviitaleaceae bacterium]
MEMILVFISAALVNNFVLSRSLGICPFIGVSKRMDTSLGMGLAVTVVMGLASAITHGVYNFVLVPLGLTFLHIITFVLITACLVQVVEMYLKKNSPGLYKALGIFLPLITTNCAVLGALLLNIELFAGSMLLAVIHALGAAAGFTLALVLFSGIRERLRYSPVPKILEGVPLAMLVAGLMSIAFLGFTGMITL